MVAVGGFFVSFYYLALFGPLLLLPLTWLVVRRSPGTRTTYLLLSLLTVSYLHMIAALQWREVFLGTSYSDRLYLTLDAHLVVTFAIFVCFLGGASPKSSCLPALCAAWISLAWLLIRAVNSVV